MRLLVEDGYNRGAEFRLDAPPVRLGRGEECAVQLLDEGISREHAEVAQGEDGLELRDLGSRNGTRLNGVPLAGAARLEPGDRISLGDVRLLLLPDPDPGQPPRPSFHDSPTLELEAIAARKPDPRPQLGRSSREELLGESTALRALLGLVERVAPTDATVLIQGETGSGKELVARALHRLSRRRQGPFVVLNGAALPQDLLESELFGHEQGAFTGALARKIGLAEAAHTGTLFLDELGELPPPTQAKLLRFLESREVVRVGSTVPITVDVRLVAATHRDLEAMVEAGTFRADLLYRLRVVELTLPPLRERGEDIQRLAETFLERFSAGRRTFSPAALQALGAYPWPGNVRELRNAVEAVSILAPGAVVDVGDLPPRVVGGRQRDPGLPRPLREVERQAVIDALAHFDGQRTKTAEALGIDRKTLYSKLKEFGLA